MGASSPIVEFEKRWSEDESPPDVFSFIAQSNIANNRQRADILLCDQYQRWKSGIAFPVEKYFENCPELDSEEELKLELIEEEYGYQEQANGAPDAKEFLARFEFLSQRARDQLMESISSSSSMKGTDDETPDYDTTIASYGRRQATPDRISRFKIVDTLGKGAYGVVYKGQDEELQRLVAIKVPTRSRIDKAGGSDAFLKEARVVAGLDHPSIVPIYDYGKTDDGRCYLVSKLIDGGSLKTRIADRMSYGAAAKLVSTIAKALHYAHREGLVHRDIKPANILIDETGNPHLVDFGLALKDEDYGHGSSLVGTPAYMSPEQAAGKGDRVDARSDIYSLGVVLFELLTASRPYRADSATDFIRQIKRGEIRPPRQFDDSIPQELDKICLTALARRPNDRYSTALDFAMDLDSFGNTSAASRGPGAQASDTIPAGFDESNQTTSDSSHGTAPPSSISVSQSDSQSLAEVTNSWLPIAAVIISLAAIGLAGLMYPWGDSSDSSMPEAVDHVRAPENLPVGALSSESIVGLQLDAAKQLGLETELRLADRLVLRLIPASSFQMGSSRDEIDLLPLENWFFKKWQRERMYHESPRHVVQISKPYYLGAHEITIRQFRRFVESTDYQTTAETNPDGGFGWQNGSWVQDAKFNWKNVGFERDDDHPVSNVSWEDASEYCKWLSIEENATFRLPTEAEWEFACRAGSTTWFHNGDRDEGLKMVANIADQSLSNVSKIVEWGRPWDDGFPFTAPVGRFQPNAFGLFDMHGNAWEWCQDWYGMKYYAESPKTDPIGPTEAQVLVDSKVNIEDAIEEARKKLEAANNEKNQQNLERLEAFKPRKYHVFRGGGWDNYPGFCRSADRYSSHSPKLRTNWAGFRVVREIDQ